MAKKPTCRTPRNRIIMMRQKGLFGPFFQNSGANCIKSVGNFVAPGMPGSGPSTRPKWQAFIPNPSTGEMAGLVGGIGGVTNARTAPINLRNQDDLYGQQDALAVGYRGGRLVGSTVYGTDENGDPLPEMPWAARFPQITNELPFSRAFYGTGWVNSTGSRLNDITGIDGAMDASTVVDNNDSVIESAVCSVSSIVQGESVAYVIYVQKDPTKGSVAVVSSINLTGGTGKAYTVNIFPADGSSSVRAETVPGEHQVDDIGDFYRIVLFVTDPAIDNTGWRYTFYPHYAGGEQGTAGCDGGHFFRADSLEMAVALADATIFVPGASAVTRDKDDIALDAANHSNTQGTYYLEVDLTGECHILGDFLSFDGTLIALTDGTNATSLFQSAGQHKIGIVYGAGKMQLNVDGVWSTEVDYDGTLLSGAFDIGRDSDWPVYVRDIQAFEDKDESIIDELMA